jgi:hypothetical protein
MLRFYRGNGVNIHLPESRYDHHMRRLLLLGIVAGLLPACGGGGSTDAGGNGDTTAPSGYAISGLSDPIDINNQSSVSFNLTSAESGTTYRYTFTDEQSAQVTDTGDVSLSSININNIDLSGLADGLIRLQLSLTDDANNIGTPVELSTTKQATPQVETINLSGQITFDRVPHNGGGIGLNYDAVSADPVREASIRIVDVDDEILASSKTDEQGMYQVNVPANTEVRVEVLSELSEANPSLNWLTQVINNSGGLYVLSGSLVDAGETDQQRNLHAESGWDGTAYSAERSAAPFAILDSIYKIYDRMRNEGVSVSMPELKVRWSTGYTGSFYQSASSSYIQVSGLADTDIDEYDEHVIVHEWRHYYEDQISRGDSIGGDHSLNSLLEPRTAFSEGSGNAWSSIILDDPIYKDALGGDQQNGFQFSMESSPATTSGWYIERSVQEIIYDLVDTNNEGVDSLSMSIKDLLDAWQSSSYLNQNSITTIFSFREVLEQRHPAEAAAITSLMQNENIMGTGMYGSGETNDGGRPYALPVYHELSVGAVPFEICSDNATGEYNRLENRQFIRFSIATEGSYKIEMTRGAGNTNYDSDLETDPDFVVYSRGAAATNYAGGEGSSSEVDSEIFTGTFEAGNYVMEAFDWFNTDENSGSGGLSCFDISILPS